MTAVLVATAGAAAALSGKFLELAGANAGWWAGAVAVLPTAAATRGGRRAPWAAGAGVMPLRLRLLAGGPCRQQAVEDGCPCVHLCLRIGHRVQSSACVSMAAALSSHRLLCVLASAIEWY